MDLKTPKLPSLQYLKHFSNLEKAFLLYTFLLIILMVALPLFKTWSLSSSETISYGFFNLGMIKTNLLALAVLWTMLWRNLSAKFRQSLYSFFWFRSSDAFVNVLGLFMLILLIFGVGDTVGVIESNFSQRVSTTSSYYVLLIYLILWLLLAGYNAYTSSSQPLAQQEQVNVPHAEDIRQAAVFKKVEEEFGGLFNDNNAHPSQQEEVAPVESREAESSWDGVSNVRDYLR